MCEERGIQSVAGDAQIVVGGAQIVIGGAQMVTDGAQVMTGSGGVQMVTSHPIRGRTRTDSSSIDLQDTPTQVQVTNISGRYAILLQLMPQLWFG